MLTEDAKRLKREAEKVIKISKTVKVALPKESLDDMNMKDLREHAKIWEADIKGLRKKDDIVAAILRSY